MNAHISALPYKWRTKHRRCTIASWNSFSLFRICALWMIVPMVALGNAAPPGIWGAGHGASLKPVFAADTAAIRFIQMERERVLVDLYPNYAVVKGTYWFRNHASKALRIHTGYPVDGENRASSLEKVTFKELLHLRVFVDGQSIAHRPLAEWSDSLIGLNQLPDPQRMDVEANWHVWEMTLPAGKVTKVEVYFMVMTPAVLSQGYGRKEGNAFEYLLQTGAAWRDSIMEGDIIVTLREGLKVRNINGVYPKNKLKYQGNQLLYHFTGLKPSPSDDLLIWYKGHADTSIARLQPDLAFQMIDKTDLSILQSTRLAILEQDNFDTPMPEWGYWIIAILVLGLLFLAGLLYGVFRLIKYLVQRN